MEIQEKLVKTAKSEKFVKRHKKDQKLSFLFPMDFSQPDIFFLTIGSAMLLLLV
jgi:hypothetical protein